jgi:ParB family chromosome partitioning protein
LAGARKVDLKDLLEQAEALFAAHQAGATRTAIRKRTGRTREEISAGSPQASSRRRLVRRLRPWSTSGRWDELALLGEFENDPQAMDRIRSMVDYHGHQVRYAVEVARRERAEAVAHAVALANLEAANVTVTKEAPSGALKLDRLADRVSGFDPVPEAHRECPGHGAFFYNWRRHEPEFYCRTPERHGYTPPPDPVPIARPPPNAWPASSPGCSTTCPPRYATGSAPPRPARCTRSSAGRRTWRPRCSPRPRAGWQCCSCCRSRWPSSMR